MIRADGRSHFKFTLCFGASEQFVPIRSRAENGMMRVGGEFNEINSVFGAREKKFTVKNAQPNIESVYVTLIAND